MIPVPVSKEFAIDPDDFFSAMLTIKEFKLAFSSEHFIVIIKSDVTFTSTFFYLFSIDVKEQRYQNQIMRPV